MSGTSAAAQAMDRMYRRQRHIYDASRKFYLLGRDGLIAGLLPPPQARVLEIGCGTARNLSLIARAYPTARCFGLDVSCEMLATAQRALVRAGLAPRVRLAQGDATRFDPVALFGEAVFERVVISYALSMIPAWPDVLAQALAVLAPDGVLHVVDFGTQEGLPRIARAGLRRWLSLFDVTPRDDLGETLARMATARGMRAHVESQLAGYALTATVGRNLTA